MQNTKIFTMAFNRVYPLYIQKVEKKGRTQEEVDEIICWLTGYTQTSLQKQLEDDVDFETFFASAPQLNPNAALIQGVICGYRVEEIEDELMRKIRYLDKLVDELAKGKSMDKILRKPMGTQDALLIDNHPIGRPTKSALAEVGIKTIDDLTNYSEKELLALHGFGPKALKILKEVMNEKNMKFKETKHDNNSSKRVFRNDSRRAHKDS